MIRTVVIVLKEHLKISVFINWDSNNTDIFIWFWDEIIFIWKVCDVNMEWSSEMWTVEDIGLGCKIWLIGSSSRLQTQATVGYLHAISDKFSIKDSKVPGCNNLE